GLLIYAQGFAPRRKRAKAQRFYSRRLSSRKAISRCGISGRRLVWRVRMPAEHRIEDEEADDVGERDVPAVLEPQPDGLGLRVHVGERHPRRRAEPDHRAAEAYGVRQVAPVVAALLERERGERNVVEHRGAEAEA